MKSSELAIYQELTMDPSYGAGRIECFLCRQTLQTGDRCLLVPTNCDETEKMYARQPYDHQLAHRSCMERVP